MAKQQEDTRAAIRSRYEFRVWGKHADARKALANLATKVSEEHYEDCYLLVDDPAWNAKVRDNALKIKQLVAERKGFEEWSRERPLSADDAPTPFDELFEEMKLDRPQRGKSYDLSKQVRKLDPSLGVRAVFVSKHRRRYEYESLRAEVTDIEIHGTDEVLRTISIEGDSLKELAKLRKQLGLRKEPNVAMHNFIETSLTARQIKRAGKK